MQLNKQPAKLFLGVVLVVALYQGAMAAGKKLVTDADARREYADSLNTDANGAPMTESGYAFFVSLPANTQIDIVIEPPSIAGCDAWLDAVAVDQPLLQDLTARGFTSIGCVRWDNGKSTTVARAIVPKRAPAAQPPRVYTPDPQGAERLG